MFKIQYFAGRAALGWSAAAVLMMANAAVHPAAASSAAPAAQAHSQMAAQRNITVTVRYIDTHDDADSGANCGDIAPAGRRVFLDDKLVLRPDNGSGWNHSMQTQKYCSDTHQTMPLSYPSGINSYTTTAAVGQMLEFEGMMLEVDPSKPGAWDDKSTSTRATGEVYLEVPPSGHLVQKILMVEGTSPAGHLRMSMLIRVTTS